MILPISSGDPNAVRSGEDQVLIVLAEAISKLVRHLDELCSCGFLQETLKEGVRV